MRKASKRSPGRKLPLHLETLRRLDPDNVDFAGYLKAAGGSLTIFARGCPLSWGPSPCEGTG